MTAPPSALDKRRRASSDRGMHLQMKVWVLVAATTVAVGCKGESKEKPAGGQKDGETAAPAAKPEAPEDLCALASAAEVGAALQIEKLEGPKAAGGAPVTMCQYSDGQSPMRVLVRYETVNGASAMPMVRKGFEDNELPTQDFPGLGDSAFSSTVGSQTSLTFLQGTTVVTITSQDPLDRQAALGRVVADKLK